MRSELCVLLLLAAVPGLCQGPQPQHETVVVTGTFEPVSMDEIDRAIRILPVRDQGLMLNNLLDLMRLDPSVDVRARAPGGVQADLSIRGSSFGQTLVLLNGQRLNDAQSGHHNLDIPMPLDNVVRVEVLRGSGSSFYGSDATAGAINIITEPPESTEIRLRTAVGNFGVNQQRGSIATSAGKFSEQLTFARDFSSGFRPDRDYRNLQFGSSSRVSTALGTTSATLGYMDHPFGADQFYGNFNSWENTKTWFAGVQQTLGQRTALEFAYRRHSDLFVLYRDRPEVFTNHHSDESYQMGVRRREPVSSNITLSYGMDGLHESIVSNNLGTHTRSRGAAFAAADFRALHRFSLSLSAREEIYRRFSGEFSPTLAGGVWLTSRVKLRASASRAFRVPSYTDLYYHDPANLGSPNLRPERAWTYEGGIDWNPASRVRGDVTVFQRRERDGIDYERRSPTDLWRALNIQNLNFTGVETSLRFAPNRSHTLDFRYTGIRGTVDTVPIGSTKYTFNYPTHSGVVAWQAALQAGVVMRTRVGVLDRKGRDPYALWDVYAASTHGKVHPFLQFTNLAGTTYQEIQGVVMPGRSMIGGIEVLLRRH